MMRNLIVLGCSALLAIALGATSYAGAAIDFDSDGVLDPVDNCDEAANGPLLGACSAQQDGNGDGFGNACDSDVNNDGQASIADVAIVLADSKIGGTIPALDLNCDGATSIADVAIALADSKASAQPGPSCDHPAGTPCP